MSGYGAGFAQHYDRLMGDVDYEARADYLLAALGKEGISPELLLDLGCGTGSLSLSLARRGISVVGVDISPDMLMLARDKAARAGADILFLEQDMRRLDLFGTVSGAVCSMDGDQPSRRAGGCALHAGAVASFYPAGRAVCI